MIVADRELVPGAAARLVGLAAILWGIVAVPISYDRSRPVFIVLVVLATAGWLVWLAARFLPDYRIPLLLGGCLVSGVAGAIVNALEHGSPAVAFPAVAAGVLLADVPMSVGAAGAVVLTAATGLSLMAETLSGSGAGYALIVVGSAAIGSGRGRQNERARETSRLLEEERRTAEERERNAALIERGRLAREIHDVLAHSLGALAIQLEVADALLTESRDVDAALPRIRQARRLAVDGLTEAREAVAALRTDAPPLPSALGTLAEQSGADFSVAGETRALSPEISLALTRIATEALTNVRKHAAGAEVSLDLAYAADGLTLTVTDSGGTATAGSDSGGGAGLAGMKERLALLGGTLSAGPAGGGWTVVATVPA